MLLLEGNIERVIKETSFSNEKVWKNVYFLMMELAIFRNDFEHLGPYSLHFIFFVTYKFAQ